MGEGESGRVFRAGEAGGVTKDAGDFGAENLVGGPKEKGRVDPPGVCDEGRRPGPDELMEPLLFKGEV